MNLTVSGRPCAVHISHIYERWPCLGGGLGASISDLSHLFNMWPYVYFNMSLDEQVCIIETLTYKQVAFSIKTLHSVIRDRSIPQVTMSNEQ